MQTTNDIFVNSSAIKTKIAGKLVNDTKQVSGKTKLFGVEREKIPAKLNSLKERKVPILGYICVCDFVMSYASDVTSRMNQSPSLNGFIGTNYFVSIRKAQRKLHQVSSQEYVAVKNAALQHLGT